MVVQEGEGRGLAALCKYHCCDGNSRDCPELKSNKAIHLELFRPLGPKELGAKVPAWAFGRTCGKATQGYLKEKGFDTKAVASGADLPWVEPGDGDEDAPGEASEGSGSTDLRKKLDEARDAVRAIEKRLNKGKDDKKRAKKPDGGEDKRKKNKERKRKESPTSSGERRAKRKRASRATGSAKDKKRGSEDAKKKRRTSSGASSSQETSKEELFGGTHRGGEGGAHKGQPSP